MYAEPADPRPCLAIGALLGVEVTRPWSALADCYLVPVCRLGLLAPRSFPPATAPQSSPEHTSSISLID